MNVTLKAQLLCNYRLKTNLSLIVIIAKNALYQSLIDFFFIILHPKCAWYERIMVTCA